MNKTYPTITALLGLLLLLPSCKDRKTYADYLKDEAKAIDLFLSKQQLTILNTYPSDGEFGEKEFYQDPATGVYYQVISYGDTTQELKWKETVYVRFSGLHYFMTSDTTRYSNQKSVYPEEIIYIGPVNSSTKGNYSNPGWVVPLEHVGHNGKVKMIIPFNMGSSYDRSQYQPTYYDLVHYRFEDQY
ncbi:MAG: DUF4827 family protein [bacterium]|nr:DUF4827 family protein [bacterium]MDD3624221.1 DUF4827 family protein [Proteiniphilum sp.]MDD3967947.1 DUF4827 family protein [Proteiniphilum sp.]MDD4458608.1 DUF4827 family protein [Proteiniphilum sp.]